MFVILAAAGNGERLGGTKKQFLYIGGKNILKISVEKFIKLKMKTIVIAVPQQDINLTKNILKDFGKYVKIIKGGSTRQDSVKNAFLSEYKNHDPKDIVLIHDAARPFFEASDVKKLIIIAKKKHAATLACATVDSIKLARNNKIYASLNRQNVYSSQTPQAFTIKLYEKALYLSIKKNIKATDDCQLIEQIKHKIYIVNSCKRNFKITTKEDLILAEFFIKNQYELKE